MENKNPNWLTRTVSIGSLVLVPVFWWVHDCEIERAIKMDEQIGIGISISNNDLSCNHKLFVVGLTNTATPSGDFIDCPVNSWTGFHTALS